MDRETNEPDGEEFEDGTPLIHLRAVYNHPNPNEYGRLKIHYSSVEELESHLSTWEDLSDEYIRPEWVQRPEGHIMHDGSPVPPPMTTETFVIEFSSDKVDMTGKDLIVESEAVNITEIGSIDDTCYEEYCSYEFPVTFRHYEVDGDYEVVELTAKVDGRPHTEVSTMYTVEYVAGQWFPEGFAETVSSFFSSLF